MLIYIYIFVCVVCVCILSSSSHFSFVIYFDILRSVLFFLYCALHLLLTPTILLGDRLPEVSTSIWLILIVIIDNDNDSK
jgi:hypothetical protein